MRFFEAVLSVPRCTISLKKPYHIHTLLFNEFVKNHPHIKGAKIEKK